MQHQTSNKRAGEAGFTLIETTIAMVIILIAMLGVAFSLTYAINYNTGNASRAKCLAVLQQQGFRLLREDAGTEAASVSLAFASADEEAVLTLADAGPYRTLLVQRTAGVMR